MVVHGRLLADAVGCSRSTLAVDKFRGGTAAIRYSSAISPGWVKYASIGVAHGHGIEPNSQYKRSVVGVLDFGKNSFIYAASARMATGPGVVELFDPLIRKGDRRPTVIVLDNASIYHSIGHDTLDRWFLDTRQRRKRLI